MPRVACTFCGLPFTVRIAPEGQPQFCCSGCALASRIPMNGDVLPVSRGLVIALALGFGLFNQVLFSVLGAVVMAQERVAVGTRLMLTGTLFGVVLLAAGVTFLFTTRARHWSDYVAGVIAAGLGAWTAVRGLRTGVTTAVWPLLAANAWLALWWSRGWLRRALRRQKST